MNDQVDVEAQARTLGWVPQDEFKGDVARWVDAETFVDKGRNIMPILQKNNDKLQAEVARLAGQNAQIQATLAQAQEAIANMEEQHTVQTQKAVEQARAQVKAQIAVASENGDHVGVAELTDQLVQMPVQAAPVNKKPANPTPIPLPPEFIQWQSENSWFGVDEEKTALANGTAQKMRKENSPLIGKPFWDAVTKRVNEVFEPKQQVATDKVEGSRNGGQSSGGKGGGKYSDLPADAKAACDDDIRSKVGEGRRYKTAAEWRARYAEIYFGE